MGTRAGNSTQFTGVISEVLIYNSALSDANRQSVEGYLAWKWGIKSSLPVGHPYLSIQPQFVDDVAVVILPPQGLLATIPVGSVGLFACKWVNSLYAGPIMKIRANTDTGGTSMQDFYIDKTGAIIGTLTNGTGTTLSAWLTSKTATIAYVHTWYDQSGLGNNMTQTTTTNQPSLVLTSSLYNVYFSNTYTAYFENTNNIIGTGKISHTISYKVADTSTLLQVTSVACVGIVLANSNITAGLFNNYTGVYGIYYDFGGNYMQTNHGSALPNNTTYTYSYDGTTRKLYYNKSLTPTTTQLDTSLNVVVGTPTRIGYCFNDLSRRFQGSLSHISVFNTALSDENRIIMENI